MSKTTLIRRRLLAWYRRHQRELPWRKTRDPYAVWISEVMLQQTQVAAVIPYYQRFMAAFPDVRRLAAADLQTVLKMWEGLGYYARARHLHTAARHIVARHSGRFPETQPEVKALPGVGDYIAAAVMSIAFDAPAAVVDGNVKRVLARLFCIAAPVNSPAALSVFQPAADRLLGRPPGEFNQALMELGALVCRPAAPLCSGCPLKIACCALKKDRVQQFPLRRKKAAVPEQHLAAAIVLRTDRRLLIVRRPENGLLGGLWDFPGGPVTPPLDPQAACTAAVCARTGICVENGVFLTRVRHAYTHFKIKLDVFTYRRHTGRLSLNGPTDHRWVTIPALMAYPLPKAVHKCLPALKDWMDSGKYACFTP